MRELASIQIISEVCPINNADVIEIVKIKGWLVVVKKGEFEVGDLCVYFEIDSFLPNIQQFSFLLKGSSLKKMITDSGKEIYGIRLKTVKLRGQVSQGLALPISSFGNVCPKEVGFDMTEILNVNKYEPKIPICMSGEIVGAFPGFIPKTDEERIQNCLDLLNTYNGFKFYITSKVDGMSSTMYKENGHFGVCSRNCELRDSEKNIFWLLAKRFEIEKRLPSGYAIQMEVAGDGIQKNRQKIKGVKLFVYYVFNVKKYKYLNLDDMKLFVSDLGLQTVPIVSEEFILNHSCGDLLLMSDHKSPFSDEALGEGLVFVLNDNGKKISFKVISNKYLLKYGL